MWRSVAFFKSLLCVRCGPFPFPVWCPHTSSFSHLTYLTAAAAASAAARAAAAASAVWHWRLLGGLTPSEDIMMCGGDKEYRRPWQNVASLHFATHKKEKNMKAFFSIPSLWLCDIRYNFYGAVCSLSPGKKVEGPICIICPQPNCPEKRRGKGGTAISRIRKGEK